MKSQNDSLARNVEILVVEDSATQARILQHLLVSNHYDVRLASNGRQALAMIEEKVPDLILTDIIMPEMDGYELCREIKAKESAQEIPVILLTSLTNPDDVIEGLSCGADNFITKPFNDDYLLGHIEQILANRKLFKVERVRVGVGVIFGGKKRFINVDQQQMLSLLLSTYEAATIRNADLIKTQEELRALNDKLEELVEVRTGELNAQREFAEILINNAQTIMLLVDPEGKIVYFNPYLAELLGCNFEEVRGQDWLTSFVLETERKKNQELFAKYLSGVTNSGNVNTIVSKKGNQHAIEWFEKAIKDKAGQITGVLSIGQLTMRGQQ